jgi:hypothetical protein
MKEGSPNFKKFHTRECALPSFLKLLFLNVSNSLVWESTVEMSVRYKDFLKGEIVKPPTRLFY